jgi:hypothetical protein
MSRCARHAPSGRAARRAAARGAAILLLVTTPAWGAGVTKEQCISADSSAQDQRRAGKFAAARESLRQCSDPACPGIVRDDCTQLLDELSKAQPTIIFDIKDGAGRDLADVTATLDGQPVAHALDGSAMRVDPGAHTWVFTEAGQEPVTQTFIIKEGEKERRERIVIGKPPPAPAPAPAPTPAGAAPSAAASAQASSPPPPPPPAGMGTQKLASLVVGGVGVVGVGLGSVFGLMTFSAASQQKSNCASTSSCSNYGMASSAHSGGETDATLSTVSFIAGGALLASGLILFLTAPHTREQAPAPALAVTPGVAPGGGGMWVSGAF